MNMPIPIDIYVHPLGIILSPHVPFVNLHIEQVAEPAEFIFKRYSFVMFFLIANVFRNGFNVTGADAEGSISFLPTEIMSACVLIDPL